MLVSGMYIYRWTHQVVYTIQYVQFFVYQSYLKSLKKCMPTQLPFSPIPKIPADTQLPLYQKEKCNVKEFKMERGSSLSHF